jgi:hypothetical protein
MVTPGLMTAVAGSVLVTATEEAAYWGGCKGDDCG